MKKFLITCSMIILVTGMVVGLYGARNSAQAFEGGHQNPTMKTRQADVAPKNFDWGIEYHPVVIGHGVPTRDAHPELFE